MHLYANVYVMRTSALLKFIPCLTTNNFLHETGRRALKFRDKQKDMVTVIKSNTKGLFFFALTLNVSYN